MTYKGHTDPRRISGVFRDCWGACRWLKCAECQKNRAKIKVALSKAINKGSAAAVKMKKALEDEQYLRRAFSPDVMRTMAEQYPFAVANPYFIVINNHSAMTMELAMLCKVKGSNPTSLADLLMSFHLETFHSELESYYAWHVWTQNVSGQATLEGAFARRDHAPMEITAASRGIVAPGRALLRTYYMLIHKLESEYSFWFRQSALRGFCMVMAFDHTMKTYAKQIASRQTVFPYRATAFCNMLNMPIVGFNTGTTSLDDDAVRRAFNMVNLIEVTSLAQVAGAIEALREDAIHDTVGMDVEWKPVTAGGHPNPSLLQLATMGFCVVFYLHQLGATLPPVLAQFLADQKMAKVGVNPAGDVTALRRRYGDSTAFEGIVNLADIAVAALGALAPKSLKSIFEAADGRHLNKELGGGARQDWERYPLPPAALAYAVNDAAAAIVAHHTLTMVQTAIDSDGIPYGDFADGAATAGAGDGDDEDQEDGIEQVNSGDAAAGKFSMLEAAKQFIDAFASDANTTESKARLPPMESEDRKALHNYLDDTHPQIKHASYNVPAYTGNDDSDDDSDDDVEHESRSSSGSDSERGIQLERVLHHHQTRRTAAFQREADAEAKEGAAADAAAAFAAATAAGTDVDGFFIKWQEELIKLDARHWMANFFLMAHSKDSALFQFFCAATSDAVFEVYDHDRRKMKAYLDVRGIDIRRHRFDTSMWYVKRGQLSDHPDVPLYAPARVLAATSKDGTRTATLQVWYCFRSSSALEGYHLSLREARKASAASASPEWLEVITNDHDFRFCVRSLKRRGRLPKWFRHYNCALLDRMSLLIEKLGMDQQKVLRDWVPTPPMVPALLIRHGLYYALEAERAKKALAPHPTAAANEGIVFVTTAAESFVKQVMTNEAAHQLLKQHRYEKLLRRLHTRAASRPAAASIAEGGGGGGGGGGGRRGGGDSGGGGRGSGSGGGSGGSSSSSSPAASQVRYYLPPTAAAAATMEVIEISPVVLAAAAQAEAAALAV
eukprot:g5687.t1